MTAKKKTATCIAKMRATWRRKKGSQFNQQRSHQPTCLILHSLYSPPIRRRHQKQQVIRLHNLIVKHMLRQHISQLYTVGDDSMWIVCLYRVGEKKRKGYGANSIAWPWESLRIPFLLFQLPCTICSHISLSKFDQKIFIFSLSISVRHHWQ